MIERFKAINRIGKLTHSASFSAARITAFIGTLGIFVICGAAAVGVAELVTPCVPGTWCLIAKNLFHLSSESSIASWYSSGLWACSAALAFVISFVADTDDGRASFRWRALAVLFAFLSMDEAAMFHERVGSKLGRAVSDGDTYGYDWQIYGAFILVVVGFLSARFMFSLPTRTRMLIITAAVVFVGGAMGFESIGSIYADSPEHRLSPIRWWFLIAAEEISEMLGVLILIYALLDYLRGSTPGVQLKFH